MNNLARKSHAKIILLGEHSVVYGQPALAMSLPFYCHLEQSPHARISQEQQDVIDDWKKNPLFSSVLWERILDKNKFQSSWHITSDIPRLGGLGSSAALSLALVFYCLKPVFGDLSPFALSYLCNLLESHYHGQPSGLDALMVNYEGLYAVQPQRKTVDNDGLKAISSRADEQLKSEIERCAKQCMPYSTKLVQKRRWHFILLQVPRISHAKTLIMTIHEKMDEQDKVTMNIMAELAALTTQGISFFEEEKTQITTLAQLINEAHELLCSLDLGHGLMDEIFALAKTYGALAGKMSGAGKGGAGFMLLPDDATRTRTLQILQAHHPHVFFDTFSI